MVKIDRGKPSFADTYESIDKSDWQELFSLKSAYLRNQVDVSAKAVIEAADESSEVFETLGFQTAEQMITEGYDLDIREVDHARKWLELSGSDAPYEKAKNMPLPVADQTEQPRNPAGRNQHTEDRSDDNIIRPIQGTDATYTCRRLLRDRPDLFERVESGELSPNAAAIEAGFRKKQISVPVGDTVAVCRRLKKNGYTLEQITEAWDMSD